MNNPPRILTVDDHLDNLALLEAILAPEGFTVIPARSGVAALEAIQTQSPDLVLLDVMMPEMDGFEVCRTLRRRLKTRFVPVIMITALTEVQDRIKGLDAGADDFISKPFNDSLLVAKIRSLLKLKQMRDELDDLQRDFSNMIVHDLRAPVHSIQGLVELLREDLPAEGGHLRLLELIGRSADKINRLISEFLDLGKLESGRLRLNLNPDDVVAIAARAIENFRPVGQRRRIELTLTASPSRIEAVVDTDRLDQVFSNLLQNAVKFSPTGGRIAVEIRARKDGIRISVADEGPGLPAGGDEMIFEKYIQSENRDSGVGLGLYVCKAIIEAHGGAIWAENRPAGGARFVFELPAEPPRSAGPDSRTEVP